MPVTIGSPISLNADYPNVDDRYTIDGSPYASVSDAAVVLGSKINEYYIGLTVLVKESSWPKAKEYWVQPYNNNGVTAYHLEEKLGNQAEQKQSDWNQADENEKDFIKNKPTKVSQFANDANYATRDQVDAKQDALVSGTNIKTVNGENLLGGGNISIPVVVVDQALSPTSTNPVQNKRIFEALANKVDKVSGKQLSMEDFTTALKQKLEAMPTINVDGDVLIINGKEYKLSPVPVVADYYIGWDTGSKSDFAAKTDAQILELATGYNVKSNPTYHRAFGSNNIFFLLYQNQLLPTKVVFTSQNIEQVQNIEEDNSCPHADVVIEGVTYKVFGIRMVTGYDQTDSITINYE